MYGKRMKEEPSQNLPVRYSVSHATRRENIVKIPLVLVVFLLSGCVHFDLSSAADSDENSKLQFCDVTSAYGWDWGDTAQTMLDARLQGRDGRVDERAVQRIVVSQKWWEVFATWCSLGLVKPVEITIWLEVAQ